MSGSAMEPAVRAAPDHSWLRTASSCRASVLASIRARRRRSVGILAHAWEQMQ
jgi:hypothetical protein